MPSEDPGGLPGEPAASPPAPGSGAPPVRRPGWLITLAIGLAVGFVASVVFAGWAVTRPEPNGAIPPRPEAPDYVDGVVDRASECVGKLFGYDHRSYAEDVAAGLRCTTGTFRKEYRRGTARLADPVKRQQAVVRAEVSAIGVVKATPERVEVLAYVDQHRRTGAVAGEKVDNTRIRLVLVPVDGTWLVSEAEAI